MANAQSVKKEPLQKTLGKYHYAAFSFILLLIAGYTLYNLSTIYATASGKSTSSTPSSPQVSFDLVTIAKVKDFRFSTEEISFEEPPKRYNPFGE